MRCINRALFLILFCLVASPVWATGVLTPAATDGGGLPAVGSEGDCMLTTSGSWGAGACPGAGSGAPTNSQYWTGAADATLSAEKNLGALGTGLVINTAGVPSIYAGVTCTNQVVRILGASGAGTCATITSAFVDTSIWTGTVSSGLLKASSQGVLAQAVSGTDYVVPAGNVATATALAANGSNCSAGQAPLGVNASGAVETCTDYQEEPASNGLVAKTAANTSAARTITGTANEITVTNGDGVSGNPTLSLPSTMVLSSKTVRIPNSTSLPGTCTVGDQYMDTDATSGARFFLCESTNTWVAQGTSSGVGGSTGSTDNALLRANGTGGSTIQASGCTLNDSDQLTCPGGFVAGTSGVGVITALEGTAPGAGTNAGEHNLYFDSADSKLKSHENGGSVVTYYSTANAQTTITGNAGTATALAANPSDCSANNFATTIAANGDLTCGQPSISAGVSGLGTGVATFLGTPSSANLRSALTDETGSGGAAVFATSPTIDAPVLTSKVNLPRVTTFPGTPSAGDTVIVTDDSTAGACDSAAGSATSLCQYSGSAWVKLGDGTSAGGALSSTDIDTSAEIAAIVGDETGSGALVFATSPTLVTPAIGAATATTPSADDNDTSVATTAYVQTELTNYAADTVTLTNKTYNVESTGNVFTTMRRIYFPAAGCNNATAGSVWDLPTSNPAVAACKTGTNTQMGVLDFADGSNLSAQVTYQLPTTWTGNVDANIKWLTSATTGNVVWQLSTICVADAETDDPAFNTASTVTDAAKGTTNQTNDAAITTVTVTGCAAGELMHLKIQRDSAHASDTLAATARLIGVELVIREAL